jgi:hypothetical protein
VGGSMVRPSILVSISQRIISGTSQGITLPRKVGGPSLASERGGKAGR